MKINQLLVAVLAVLFVGMAAWGQAVSTAQISGDVTDQTGAVVPDAQVVLTQTNTGLNRTATTDSNGYYVMPALPIGPYRLNVTKQGFTAYVQTGIVLQVSSNPVLNVTLGIGAVTTEVTVQAGAQMVETQSNGVGTVVDQQRVEELPLQGRQLTQLIFISGSANTAPNGDLNSNKNYPTVSIAVNGGLPNGVTFLLDGSTHNDPFNNLNLPLPFPDATQEFKVETSALPAQYGDHAAAAVNAVTKSGTNSFHGDAFEFVRNYKFNARQADQAARDSLKRNQFGGVLGGPIKRDKVFFFAGYQQTITKSNPSSSSNFVPTAAMLGQVPNDANCAGLPGAPTQCLDFTTFASAACNTSGAVTLKGPFLGNNNVAPLSALNAQAVNILKLVPVSTDPKGCGLISFPIGANQSEELGVGRIDYQLSSKQTLYGRYFIGNSNLPVTWDNKNVLELNKVAQFNRAQSLAIGDTYTITPNLINSLHLTALRTLNLRVLVPYFDPQSLGIHDTSDGSPNLIPGFMGLSVAGGLSLGAGATNPGYFNSTVWQFADDVNFIRGSHQITLGVDYIYSLMNTANNRPTNGAFTFSSGSNGLTGLGYADFLTGSLDSLLQGNPDIENDGDNYFGLYAQDSWKATRRLTLNYGVRWEPYFPYHNMNLHAQIFNPADFASGRKSLVYLNSPPGLTYPGDFGYPGHSYQLGKKDDFAPRLGLVWDPKGDGKMTIRAGYGMFYDSPQLFFDTRYSNSPPWGASVSLTGPFGAGSFTNPWATYPGPPAGVSPFPALNAVSKNMAFPSAGVYVNSPLQSNPMYLEQWNLSIQKQMGSWLFSGTYLGNETKHLPTSFEQNPGTFIPGTLSGGNCTFAAGGGKFVGGPYNGINDGLTKAGTVGQTSDNCSQTGNISDRRVLFLQNQAQGGFYSTIGTLDQGGNANYNGLLISAQHRLAQNFSIQANWTYSHCLSEAETTELTGPSYVIPGDRAASYSNCDSDVRHVVNISFVANTPKFSNRFMEAVAGGWQFSSIISKRTGTYSSITTGNDIALTGIGGQLATQLSTDFYAPNKGSFASSNSCNPTGTPPSCSFRVNYLNNVKNSSTSFGAWGSPATGTYSLMPPLTVANPGSLSVDTSLVRSFKIRESQTVQFRWEVFNLPNHVNLGNPGTSFTSTTFGLITSAGSPRIMQFALKYAF